MCGDRLFIHGFQGDEKVHQSLMLIVCGASRKSTSSRSNIFVVEVLTLGLKAIEKSVKVVELDLQCSEKVLQTI